MRKSLEERVRRRAKDVCEYCKMPQVFYRSPFQIEHILARKHGGKTVPANLAVACMHCNLHKGPNISGIDPGSRRMTRLFNPRTDDWNKHFEWNGATLVGRTAIGRTTVAVLNMNDDEPAAVREALIDEGQFPPPDRLGKVG
jgi:hypothetical protein